MAVAAFALALGACGSDAGAPRATTTSTATTPTETPRKPALCGPLRSRVAGRIGGGAVRELSGLVRSRRQPGVLWTHNDSGDSARLFAVGDDATLRAEVQVSGATNVDWEDIAIRGGELYVADIGDNAAQRASVSVYRVAEPRIGDAAVTATAASARIDLRYPGGARDAEALLVDPSSGALVIVEKRFDGRSGVYVADRPVAGSVTTLRRTVRLSLGLAELVTAADISPDGSTIAVRTYGSLFAWSRRRGESVARTLRRQPCKAGVDLEREGQGEALALSRTGRSAYAAPEGSLPRLSVYTPR